MRCEPLPIFSSRSAAWSRTTALTLRATCEPCSPFKRNGWVR